MRETRDRQSLSRGPMKQGKPLGPLKSPLIPPLYLSSTVSSLQHRALGATQFPVLRNGVWVLEGNEDANPEPQSPAPSSGWCGEDSYLGTNILPRGFSRLSFLEFPSQSGAGKWQVFAVWPMVRVQALLQRRSALGLPSL
jgi:hypothetical protein